MGSSIAYWLKTSGNTGAMKDMKNLRVVVVERDPSVRNFTYVH